MDREKFKAFLLNFFGVSEKELMVELLPTPANVEALISYWEKTSSVLTGEQTEEQIEERMIDVLAGVPLDAE